MKTLPSIIKKLAEAIATAIAIVFYTIREIAVTNQDAGLAIGLALAIAIICYGISRSAAVVIRAWRS